MSTLALREAHAFEAAGQEFLYLVPSAAVFALDECSVAVLDAVRDGDADATAITRRLASRFDETAVRETIVELQRVRAIADHAAPSTPKILPLKPVPLQTL